MLHVKFMALCFIEPELLSMEVLHCGNRDFRLLLQSCDLDFDPMTFIYERDPHFREIYRMCEYEPCKSRLSKVIVRQTDRQTRPKLYTTSFCGWSKILQLRTQPVNTGK